MKKILRLIISGIVGFWIPIAVIVFFLERMFHFVHDAVAPIEAHLPNLKILGVASIVVFVIFLMIILCILGGLLLRMTYIRKRIKMVERTILGHIPGYNTVKVMFDDEENIQEGMVWSAVLIEEDEGCYSLGYTSYSSERYYAIHKIADTSITNTELVIIAKEKVKPLDISTQEFLQYVKRVKNIAELVEKTAGREESGEGSFKDTNNEDK